VTGLYSAMAGRLANGEPHVRFRPRGHSMEPLIRDRQEVVVWRLRPGDPVTVGMIVLAKVQGKVYLHLVSAVDGDRVQISNNHGHVNGWTSRDKIYGRYVR
jgi:signal peptidase I